MIKTTTWAHFQQLAQHPKAGMDAMQMVRLCTEQGVQFDDYAAQLQLQLDMIDAFDKYHVACPDDNQLSLIRVCAGAAASACGWLTREAPLPGSDVASMLVNDVVVTFANFFGKSITWTEPKRVNPPSHDSTPTFN
jgi:hypothetical protein